MLKVDNKMVSKIFNFQLHTFKGQTLIETLAALAVISIVMSAIAISITTALSNAKFNQYQTLATKYAQQGSEIVHQIRDDSYTNFTNYNGTYCLAKGQTSLGSLHGSCTTPNVDNFIRSIQIEQSPGCGPNVAKITTTVSFTDGKCQAGTYCHNQVDTSCLSTVNPVQAP